MRAGSQNGNPGEQPVTTNEPSKNGGRVYDEKE
jgi:hypothetical protein